MRPEREKQAVAAPGMSFSEIILTYGRTPPVQVMEYLRTGRPAKQRNGIGHEVLMYLEEAGQEAGLSLREIRDEMKTVLGVWPENLSRPLTIDEAFALCDIHSLEPSGVFLAAKARFDARNERKEDAS